MDDYHQVQVIERSESLYIHIGHRYSIRILNTLVGLISSLLVVVVWNVGYGPRKAEFLLIFGFISSYSLKNAIFGYSDHLKINLKENTISNSKKHELQITNKLKWIRYYSRPSLLSRLFIVTKGYEVHEKVVLSNGNEKIDFLPKHQHVVRGRKKCPLYIETRRLLENVIGTKIKVTTLSNYKNKPMTRKQMISIVEETS